MAAGLWVPRRQKPASGAVLNLAHPLAQGLVALWVCNEHGGWAYDCVRWRPAVPQGGAQWGNGGLYAPSIGTEAWRVTGSEDDTTLRISTTATCAYHGTLRSYPTADDRCGVIDKHGRYWFGPAGTARPPVGGPAGALTLVWWSGLSQQWIQGPAPPLATEHSAGITVWNNGANGQASLNGRAVATTVFNTNDGDFGQLDATLMLAAPWPGTLQIIALASRQWLAEDWTLWHEDPFGVLTTR